MEVLVAVENKKGAMNPLILYKYSASWCSPCKQMNPIVTKLCSQRSIAIREFDISQLSEEDRVNLNLRSVPTYDLYRQTTEEAQFLRRRLGSCSEKDFKEFLDS